MCVFTALRRSVIGTLKWLMGYVASCRRRATRTRTLSGGPRMHTGASCARRQHAASSSFRMRTKNRTKFERGALLPPYPPLAARHALRADRPWRHVACPPSLLTAPWCVPRVRVVELEAASDALVAERERANSRAAAIDDSLAAEKAAASVTAKEIRELQQLLSAEEGGAQPPRPL